MFGFSVRTLANGLGSPRSTGSPGSASGSPSRPDSPKGHEVGEIDTRAPFESVRAAVSLFGDSGSPRARPVTKKTKAEEQKLLEKEAQHHVILRELDHYKDQLQAAKAAKAEAARDLKSANETVQQLTNKLEALSESKQDAIQATEAAKARAMELEEKKSIQADLGVDAWKSDVDAERELYKSSSQELISSKQELTNLRQDFDAALEAKLAAFQEAENAAQAAQANQETREQLLGEVAVLNKTLEQVKLASLQAEEDHMKLIAEKEIHLIVHKTAKEAAEEEIERLKHEYGDDENLQEKLEETSVATEVLQEQLKGVRASDLNSLTELQSELNAARKELKESTDEEAVIRNFVLSLTLQLEEARKKLPESDKIALEAETKVEQLQFDLENTKAELDAAMSRDIISETQAQLNKLLKDAEKDRSEAEKITKEVESLWEEAEAAKVASKEVDEKLEMAIKEAEAAKVASKQADDQIYNSPRGDVDKDSGSIPIRKIKLSTEEFKSMNNKIEESTKQADEKEAILMAQIQSLTDRKNEVQKKIEELLKECEATQSEIEDAEKQAEVAEVAKSVVKKELGKWLETGHGEATSIPEEK
ncbi:WEB family protein At1g12150-like [Andrographis paniculata]|uniref:WEB family protein At1g12150-like n=1 Tax=Andrographis paniculata TaxID=175694 RepID=UPI0021E8F4EF|nr:WEB family protein At1g12150-like [Andrographis paniculata]